MIAMTLLDERLASLGLILGLLIGLGLVALCSYARDRYHTYEGTRERTQADPKP